MTAAARTPKVLKLWFAALWPLSAAACTIGFVDVPVAEPAPVRFHVLARVLPLPESGLVRVFLSAWLDAGVSDDGTPRQLASTRLVVDGHGWPAEDAGSGPARQLTWDIVRDYEPPVPELVTLRPPLVVGDAEAISVRIPLAFELSPPGPISIPLTEDLTFHSQPPAHVSRPISWRLVITSRGAPAERFEMSSSNAWPTDVRVPSAMLPEDLLRLDAMLQVAMRLDSLAIDAPEGSDYDIAARVEVEHNRAIERVPPPGP